jgi:hypothetical protein
MNAMDRLFAAGRTRSEETGPQSRRTRKMRHRSVGHYARVVALEMPQKLRSQTRPLCGMKSDLKGSTNA